MEHKDCGIDTCVAATTDPAVGPVVEYSLSVTPAPKMEQGAELVDNTRTLPAEKLLAQEAKANSPSTERANGWRRQGIA